MSVEIIITADGSHSLLNTQLDETYHSRHGALQESKYVFIQQGLEFYHSRSNAKQIKIFEMGFGTGLNAWLAEKWAREKKINVSYISVEAFPLPKEIYTKLNYGTSADDQKMFVALHECPWQQEVSFNNFSLIKLQDRIEQLRIQVQSFDIIFYDAFAPNKQPEMWTPEILSKVVACLKSGGVFVTYCAKGQVKRDLKSCGLDVETLPGPPGKKEMVRALKI